MFKASKYMRIFFAFLVIETATMIWMLPMTPAIYDFRTDLREDSFTSDTGVGQDSDNVTLSHILYDNDPATIDILSSISDDTLAYSSYNSTSRLLGIAGLSANTTRTLIVSYDIDALRGADAVNTFADIVPWVWLLCVVAFPMAALAAILMGRAG